ncbi:AN1-type zinc finger protein 3-like [Hippocampus comes]|uniref:Zinc finger AN1-type containing 3 n=1 Tax=Hippocampus comes TaxID=109280 RepID=A0A3Q2XY47_HIPCM|nr:PREDICTED: AN1-type zinc finger protein 3-like [Hippocampus comes]
MGDTSERSKPPGLPPRCPCGFWGSSKTMNMCSKCFADIKKKQPGEDSQSAVFTSGSGETAAATATKAPSISSSPSLSPPTAMKPPAAEEASPLFATSAESVSSTVTAQGTMQAPAKRPRESASTSESEATPEKRPRAEAKEEEQEDGEEAGGGTPKQKNRRRCYSCQSKLELVQQELGSCRCGYVFCMLHRLPEQHDCLFDHLGRGRQEAVLKMVKLDRKVGRSCQRIGEECS